MKQIKLNLIKKNRVWIDCKTEKGYECKLKINELSKNLPLGEQELCLNDISVRSKYGTEIKYEIHEQQSEKTTFLKCGRYNKFLVEKCKSLGGKWDAEEKVWVFPSFLSNEIEELEYLFCGEEVTLEIEAKEVMSKWCGSVDFIGYPIAIASGRDSGARLGEGVYKISGKIYSAGSMKNWSTEVSEGSTFRLKISKNLLEEYEAIWNYKIID